MKKLMRMIMVFLFSSGAFAGSSKLAQDLKTASGTVRVIVQFNAPVAQEHIDLISARGGKLHRKLDLIQAGTFDMPAEKLAELADDPRVTHISMDHPVSATLDYAAAAVNAPYAWNAGWTGYPIDIAIIDSGVSAHPDLTNSYGYYRVDYSESFVPNVSSTADAYGHGTHVAGIAIGNGYASSGYYDFRTFIGIAPRAWIVNLKALDANGVGSDTSVIAAIQRAIDLKNTYPIRVINLSLGRPVFESYTVDPLCQAVEKAWKAGLVVVVAAGNFGRDNSQGENGYGTITAPGNDPYVITVGAMKAMNTPQRTDDLIATYSSKGPTAIDHFVKPDILAPGNTMTSLRVQGSTLDVNHPEDRVPTQAYDSLGSTSSSKYYFALSGTSMATPVVSGAVALLLEKDPTLTPDLVKARLMKTAYKTFPVTSAYYDAGTQITYTSQYDIFTVGAGYLDIAAALSNVERPSGLALSPTAVYDTSTQTASLAYAQSVIWGGTVTWGSSVIWGGNVNSGSTIIWGGSANWSSSTSSGFTVIWGGTSPFAASTSDTSTVLTSGEK
jgi:serine protease AprX